MKTRNSTLKIAATCAAIGWLCAGAGYVCQAQNGYSPDLQEVVKLSQAHMPDDVIRNYISSSGKTYRLSADDIIYLNSQGVSPGVISALQTASSPVPSPEPQAPVVQQTAPPPPPQPEVGGSVSVSVEATPPPPVEVNFQYFHDQLSPFGAWVTVDGATYWRPDQAVAVNPDWRPYYDMGQWVQTDNGLYWQSDYTWGDIPFHYGRWVLLPGMGWVWSPDYTWGPAWVFWRDGSADGCMGWAPLPVGAVFVNGGFWWHGVAVGADFDFGLGESCFTFVDCAHFHEGFFRMRGHEWAYNIDRVRVHNFYSHTVVRNEFHRDDHGRFVNNGIGRDRVEHLTHVEHANFEERNPVGDRNKLASVRTEQLHNQTALHAEQGHGQAEVGHNQYEQVHGQPNNNNNAGTEHDRTVRTTTENSTVHDSNLHGQTFNEHTTTSSSSVSKVYRPPATTYNTHTTQQGGGGGGAGSSTGRGPGGGGAGGGGGGGQQHGGGQNGNQHH